MCRSCAGRRPSRREPCAFCGKLAIAAARTSAGAECGTCRTRRMRSKITCERCERHARPSAAQPGVCERCAGERVAQICQSCGAEEQNYTAGRCGACSLQRPRRRARRAATRPPSHALSGYLAALAASPKPLSTLNWITTSRGFRTLQQLLSGRCRSPTRRWTRSVAAQTTSHLRAELVKHGALPERSERTAGLALLIEHELLRVPDGPDRVHLRDLRDLEGPPRPRPQRAPRDRPAPLRHARPRQGPGRRRPARVARRARSLARHPRARAPRLVARQRHRAPQTCPRVHHLDRPPQHHRPADRHAAGHPPARRPARPRPPPALLRRCSPTSSSISATASPGLLIVAVLAAHQPPRAAHPRRRPRTRRAGAPGDRPRPAAAPRTARRPSPETSSTQRAPWLIPRRPGRQPPQRGLHARAAHQARRQSPPRPHRRHQQLASRLPAAILADLLGFADTTTERWTKPAAGDWTRYAASRATTTP